MSGVAIVWSLLTADTLLTDVVSADNIRSGILPINTTPPAIGIKTIDSLPRLNVAMESTRRQMVERVQVTVITHDYPSKKTILNLVRDALPLSRGTVNGFSVDSVLPDIIGPDLDDPGTNIYEQSCDYLVRWNEGL